MDLNEFMKVNCIKGTSSSFYFQLGKNNYRVSNHKAKDSQFHVEYLEKDVIEIIVKNPKKQLMKIYNNLKQRHFGVVLDITPVGSDARIVVDLYSTSGKDYNKLLDLGVTPVGYEGGR